MNLRVFYLTRRGLSDGYVHKQISNFSAALAPPFPARGKAERTGETRHTK